MFLEVRKANRRSTRQVTVPGDGLTIGRASSNALVLNDRAVSRKHCFVRANGSGGVLEDLRSSSGTRLNQRKIDEAPLKDGDVIAIGPYRLKFRVGQPKASSNNGQAGSPSKVAAPANMPVPSSSPVSRPSATTGDEIARALQDLSKTKRQTGAPPRVHTAQAESPVSDGRKRIHELEARLGNSRDELVRWRADAKSTAARVTQLEQELSDRQRALTTLEQQTRIQEEARKALQDRSDTLAEANARLASTLKQLEQASTSDREECSQAQLTLEQKNKAIAEHLARIATLGEAVARAERVAADATAGRDASQERAEEAIAGHLARITSLGDSLEKASRQASEAVSDRDAARTTAEAVAARNEELLARMAQTQVAAETTQKQLGERDKKIESLQGALDGQIGPDDGRAEYESLETSFNELQDDHQNGLQQEARLEQKLGEHAATIETIESRRAQLELTNVHLAEELDGIRTSLAESEGSRERSLRDLKAKEEDLRSERDRADQSARELKDARLSARSDADALDVAGAHAQRLSKEVERLKADAKDQTSELEQARTSARTDRKKRTEANGELAALKEELEGVRAEHDQLRANVQAGETEQGVKLEKIVEAKQQSPNQPDTPDPAEVIPRILTANRKEWQRNKEDHDLSQWIVMTVIAIIALIPAAAVIYKLFMS